MNSGVTIATGQSIPGKYVINSTHILNVILKGVVDEVLERWLLGGHGGSTGGHNSKAHVSTGTISREPCLLHQLGQQLLILHPLLRRLYCFDNCDSLGFYYTDAHPCTFSFPLSGLSPLALSVFVSSSKWIIDSGASKRMTGCADLFRTYTPLSGKDKLWVVDGTPSPTSGKGSIACLPQYPYFHVVPSFSANLLFVKRLTESLSCSVPFSLCLSEYGDSADTCSGNDSDDRIVDDTNLPVALSPGAWFDRFYKAMSRFGYRPSREDNTMFIELVNGKITILIVYVDDIVATGNDNDEASILKSLLAREVEIKDVGPLRYFLGTEVASSAGGIFIA
ncbi:hypothetical protein RJ640_019542 [Escallonia rubra]|uniref:Reverse transcriptase Ty1/copia-type domain-containing protein n=1 Tax=Escallonia rubra TaxID=112253 RepID=A0AA88QZN3_9ASTE|nr:hypothetical protein RJ640_019542 [Escallonia rubra]